MQVHDPVVVIFHKFSVTVHASFSIKKNMTNARIQTAEGDCLDISSSSCVTTRSTDHDDIAGKSEFACHSNYTMAKASIESFHCQQYINQTPLTRKLQTEGQELCF